MLFLCIIFMDLTGFWECARIGLVSERVNMKKIDSVKALLLAITIICLFEFAFGFSVKSLESKTYKTENAVMTENNTIPSIKVETANIDKLDIEPVVVLDINYELDIAEGVSLEEIEKQKMEARMKEVVYDNMTLGELSSKLDRSLNSTLANKGYVFADYAVSKGVDPYLAVAIALHETGCKWKCSNAVNSYYNVGGMMGSNGLLHFNSLDEGIKAFIDNLYNNYVAYGLTTPEVIGPKYAASTTWPVQVSSYINQIKAA